jgi:pyridoxal 5'-phosphate synthase pdxT subunit
LQVGPAVEVLVTFGGEPVLVRQGKVIGATFNPELGAGAAVHRRVFS